jgi:hypothetical protein
MVDYVDKHQKVKSGMFCYSPDACSKDEECPFTVESVTELVIYDYLIGNNDRIGNCFIYPGSREPLRLDQGGSHLHSLEWRYPTALLRYPSVKRVFVRDIIAEKKYNKHICLANSTEYGKRIVLLSKTKNQTIGTLLTNTLVDIPSFHQSGTQAYRWLNNNEDQHAFDQELTSRVQELATYWHSHCSPPQQYFSPDEVALRKKIDTLRAKALAKRTEATTLTTLASKKTSASTNTTSNTTSAIKAIERFDSLLSLAEAAKEKSRLYEKEIKLIEKIIEEQRKKAVEEAARKKKDAFEEAERKKKEVIAKSERERLATIEAIIERQRVFSLLNEEKTKQKDERETASKKTNSTKYKIDSTIPTYV